MRLRLLSCSEWVPRLARLVLALGFLAVPLVGWAQLPNIPHVGLLTQDSPQDPATRNRLRDAMRDLGYVEGQSLVIDVRWSNGNNERLAGLAAELAALNPAVIVAETTAAALAAKHVTATIPIVMVSVSDPVASGLIASLSHSGNNITGVSDFGIELTAKQLDLLHAVVPKAKRVAVLMSDNPVHPLQVKAIQDAAKGMGLTILPTMVRSYEDFEQAFASMAKKKAEALIPLGGAPFGTRRERDKIVELALKAGLPTFYTNRWPVSGGGLLSYGPSTAYKWKQAAQYVDKLLKGAKPDNLPVQQPTVFELVINLKTAKALALAIPASVRLLADEVIQ